MIQERPVDPGQALVVSIDPSLKDLVPVFLLNRRRDVHALLAALSRADFDGVRMIGHSMKGAGGGYGFDAITDLGMEIEQAALSREPDRIRKRVAELADFLGRVKVVTEPVPPRRGEKQPLILSVDDDPDTLNLLQRLLGYDGFEVVTADGAGTALSLLKTVRPDLILMDVMMPEVDGYALCSLLQEDETLAYVPVIFVTALGDPQSKARAFAVGAVDYLVKPPRRKLLLEKITEHLKTHRLWEALRAEAAASGEGARRPNYTRFKSILLRQLRLNAEVLQRLFQVPPHELYPAFAAAGVDPKALAQKIAAFLKLPYRARLCADDVKLGVLPTTFCRYGGVVPVAGPSGGKTFVLSNPFDWQMLDALKRFRPYKIAVIEPGAIAALFDAQGKEPS